MLVALLVVVLFFLLVCFFLIAPGEPWNMSFRAGSSALAELFLGIGGGTSETFLS